MRLKFSLSGKRNNTGAPPAPKCANEKGQRIRAALRLLTNPHVFRSVGFCVLGEGDGAGT
jgi:hypothetical protein